MVVAAAGLQTAPGVARSGDRPQPNLGGDVNTYIFKQENSYNSEALGFYATLGAEYNIIKQIAVVIEAEKVWSKADGFKGAFKTDFYDPFENSRTIEEGKASLYYYEK